MSDLQAIVLGFLQGFSEWLPISSTAHVAVGLRLFGLSDMGGLGAAFTAVSQLGSVLAALIYFRKDILAVLVRSPRGAAGNADGEPDRRLLLPIAVGTVPVVVSGVLLKPAIEGPLRGMYVVSASMMSFALILAWTESRASLTRRLGSVTVWDGLLIGVGQTFSLIPGASRSGTTITAALATGLERTTAARFSFLLSLPAITGAGLYEMAKHRHEIVSANMTRPLVLATAVAFVVGWASIDLLLKFLRRHPTYVFAGYRIIVGAVILTLIALGVLTP
jgi:undecaprenyl-diphosphatase